MTEIDGQSETIFVKDKVAPILLDDQHRFHEAFEALTKNKKARAHSSTSEIISSLQSYSDDCLQEVIDSDDLVSLARIKEILTKQRKSFQKLVKEIRTTKWSCHPYFGYRSLVQQHIMKRWVMSKPLML